MVSVTIPSCIFLLTLSAPPGIYTLSLHDALPIFDAVPLELLPVLLEVQRPLAHREVLARVRSEEHTSELQSRFDLVCRLLLEKKNTIASDLIPTDSIFGLIAQDRHHAQSGHLIIK